MYWWDGCYFIFVFASAGVVENNGQITVLIFWSAALSYLNLLRYKWISCHMDLICLELATLLRFLNSMLSCTTHFFAHLGAAGTNCWNKINISSTSDLNSSSRSSGSRESARGSLVKYVSLVCLIHWSFIWLRFVRGRAYGCDHDSDDH